ncbi:MAG: hypothetical protein LBU99_00070 [Spirochaetaceae bacterium]|jgi:hypothetical protein|nr:hypothetical protein [Spirochaetaceae bacterium]
MTTAFLLTIIAAVLCYLIIPLLDYIRRFFMGKKLRLLFKGTQEYPDWVDRRDASERRSSFSGRFYGVFDAFEEPGILWIRNGPRTVAVKYENAKFCYLEWKKEGSREHFELRSLPWSKVASLETGLRVYAAGRVLSENGAVTFFGTPETPLLIILDDTGENERFEESVIEGSFHCGYGDRSVVTLLSYFAGMAAVFFLLVQQLGNYSNDSDIILSLILLCVPGLPYIPPGILFTFLYRKFRSPREGALITREKEDASSTRFSDIFPPGKIFSRVMFFLAAALNAVFLYLILLALLF